MTLTGLLSSAPFVHWIYRPYLVNTSIFLLCKMMNVSNCSLLQEDEGLDLADIPLIKQSDNLRLLPKYSAVLAKSSDDGVGMDDLDQLQLDLEKLCSTCTVRIRYLLSEIGEADRNNEGFDHTAHEKTSLKRKRSDETPKFKDLRNSMRVIKKQEIPSKFLNDPQKAVPIYNDTSEKFWSSIQPFCSSTTNNDVALIDGLISEFSKDIDVKIPEIGEKYANGWSGEIYYEDNLSKPMKRVAPCSEMQKNGLNQVVETFATPLTQRLLAALIEEKVMPANGENGSTSNNAKLLEFTKLKSTLGSQKIGACSDRRLKKELMEQGIINMEDFSKELQGEYSNIERFLENLE